MTLLNILQEFENSITLGDNVISNAHSQDGSGKYLWDIDSRKMITESAFLRNFIAWELFLEKSFTAYMMGEICANGNTIIRYITPLDHEHANNITKGISNFIEWGNAITVKKISKLYFKSGEPFHSTLSSIESTLSDIKTVRNATAHTSSTTSAKLDILSNRVLGKSIKNTTAYDFILSINSKSPGSKTIYQEYMDLLKAAAYQIAYT